MVDQRRDVLRPLAQRRHHDPDHVEAEVEVLAEFSLLHQGFQVAIRRGHDAGLDEDVAGAAQAPEPLLVQRAQHLGLERQAHLPDLVQEEGAAVGDLHETFLRALGVGVAAPLEPEELALEEGLRDGAAVHFHEGAGVRGPQLVDLAREELLSHARLSLQEHGGASGRRHFPDGFEDLRQLRASAHDQGRARPPPLRRAEARHLLGQPRLREGVLDHELHVIQLERLSDVVETAGLRRFHRVLEFSERGHDHDLHLGMTRADVSQEVQPVPVRKLLIEESQVVFLAGQTLPGFRHVSGRLHPIPLLREPLLQRVPEGLLVVHHQNAEGLLSEDYRAWFHVVSPRVGRSARSFLARPRFRSRWSLRARG